MITNIIYVGPEGNNTNIGIYNVGSYTQTPIFVLFHYFLFYLSLGIPLYK